MHGSASTTLYAIVFEDKYQCRAKAPRRAMHPQEPFDSKDQGEIYIQDPHSE